MTLKTWSFSKKKNSTAQPSGSSRDYTVYMKENTSIERPVFIIGTGIDAGINYCQFSGNYYFIDDIELLSKDQVALHCSIDVLATHKASIGAYTGYVKRSSAASSSYIIDSAISIDQNIVNETMATTDLFDADQSGCYIVRCVSPASHSSPTGIASYVMSHRELEALLDFLTDPDNFSDLFDDIVVKSFFNPFQYILSIMWFPMSRNDIPGSDSDLQLGWWDVEYYSSSGSWKELTSPGYFDNVQINKPTRYYTNDFRSNYRAFTEVKAYIPGLGVVDLDPMALSANLYAEVSIDYVTGNMNVGFYERSSQGGVTVNKDCFGTYSTQLGVPIQCGQTTGLQSAATMLANNNIPVISDVATGVVQAVDMVSGGVSGIFRAGNDNKSVIGSTGNMIQVLSHPRLIMYQRAYGSSDAPNAVYGRPLCRNRQLSTLPGYIQCEAASISLAAPDTETEEVNNYLNTGFYYE